MAFQVSPGVQVKEIDLTNVVPAVASTTGGYAGTFRWGPVDEVVTVSDSKALVDTFGTPAKTNAGAEDFYSAEAFLKYGSNLRVVRIATTGLFSANTTGATDQLIKNLDDYEANHKDGTSAATLGMFTSRFGGAMGNSLRVHVCGSSTAYSEANVTTASETARGATSVTVADSSEVVVRDVISFAGHATKYRVLTIPDGTTITIEQIGAPSGTGLSTSVSASENISRNWEFYDLFDNAPGRSTSAIAAGGSDDEVHIVVEDEDGRITGAQHQVLEIYAHVSLASDAKDAQGASNYYVNVLARDSQYILWTGHSTDLNSGAAADDTHLDSVTTAFGRPVAPLGMSLTGGADGRSPTAGQKYGAWDTHFSSDEQDISFLVVGSTRTDDGTGDDQDLLLDWTAIINEGIRIVESRKDCLLVASPRRADVVNVASESTQVSNVIATVDTATSSSYVVFDSGWVYSYDKYNDKYCWIPANGHTAGIMVRTDLARDPWFSPAGFNRGQYLGVTKLAMNPKKGSRDDLYRKRINPIVTFPGQGTVLYGDKTGLATPSAFDRINVRRLFIVLEKAIATAAKAQLFEFNDAFTRAQFRAAVEPFLRDVKNRRGLIDFAVVCDESNNTDTVIDRNEFVCSIFIKPARSINFITLNFVAARTGVEFEELYGAV
jgi:hypothetical protein